MELQRTSEWLEQRKYKYTSSNIWKLMTEPKSKEAKSAGALSETAKEYVMEKIVEELDGFLPEYESNAMIYGQEQEKNAAYWYQFRTGLEVIDTGFIEVNSFYGGSPDKLVLDRNSNGIGCVEIKCPYNSTNHLWHCLIDSNNYFKASHKEYYWQCVSHIYTAKADWCDFVSFDPRINHEIGFFKFRISREDVVNDVFLLNLQLDKANKYKVELKRKLGLL